MLKICPACGQTAHENVKYCSACGNSLLNVTHTQSENLSSGDGALQLDYYWNYVSCKEEIRNSYSIIKSILTGIC